MEHGRWVFCCCKAVPGAVKGNAVQLLKITLQERQPSRIITKLATERKK